MKGGASWAWVRAEVNGGKRKEKEEKGNDEQGRNCKTFGSQGHTEWDEEFGI